MHAVQALLRERLGLELARPTLLQVVDASGGNPFFALELGRALDGDGSRSRPASRSRSRPR